jgi:NADP-dependent 3-hydroxy acid dehydrogenase YdfG
MSGIEGKVIAVIGASSGIGEATAKHLAERGAAVMLNEIVVRPTAQTV